MYRPTHLMCAGGFLPHHAIWKVGGVFAHFLLLYNETMYLPTIGLEIHIELKTATKMFCGCKNNPEEPQPNVNVCPICLAHPGTLPVPNREAIGAVLKLGMALGGTIAERSHFDRKSYFYPDLPKGYQISQYEEPLVTGGILNGVRITRIHLEEDTARLIHSAPRPNGDRIKTNKKRIFDRNSVEFGIDSSANDSGATYVDFNRAGVPLMELVTEPDVKNAREAVQFAAGLQRIVRYLGISDGDMEKGHMRVEANVSIRPNGDRIETNASIRPNSDRIEANSDRMNDDRIVLKDESYRLMGLLFEVQNKLGSVYKEKNYQDAIEEVLKREEISYEREKRVPLKLDGKAISDFFVDFLIDGKILLEVKATKFITQEDIRQVLRYIREVNVPLGIVANFRGDKLEYKRVINPTFAQDSVGFDRNSSASPLGTKVEVKNLNSFKAVHDAIEHELERQEHLLERGEKIAQETRGWNEKKGVTESQRSKESAHDYRYFPEPDIPPLDLSAQAGLTKWDLEKLRQEIPELPEAKRRRFEAEFGLAPEQAELITEDMAFADYFEQAASEFKTYSLPTTDYQLLCNYLTSDLRGLMNEKGTDVTGLKMTPEHFAHLVALVAEGKLSSRLAKDLLAKMFETGEDPEIIMKESGVRVIGDESELDKIVGEVIKKNPKAVGDYKKGKGNALQFLVGQAMANTKGQASPEKLRGLFEKKMK